MKLRLVIPTLSFKWFVGEPGFGEGEQSRHWALADVKALQLLSSKGQLGTARNPL